jgi:hypothetical protein
MLVIDRLFPERPSVGQSTVELVDHEGSVTAYADVIVGRVAETRIIPDQGFDDGKCLVARLLVASKKLPLRVDAGLPSVIGVEKISRHAARQSFPKSFPTIA